MEEQKKSIETQVAEWSATDAALREAVALTEGITVEGHAEGEKKGYQAAEKARKDLKAKRVEIENRRAELKRPILDLGKLVDSEARRLTALVEPREIELSKDAEKYEARIAAIKKAEEDRVAAERAEAERLAREALQARVQSVVALGGVPDLGFLGAATDSDFADLLATLQAAKDEREAIAAREAAEAAERARIADEERIAREKAEAIERAKREAEEAAERAEQEARAAAERKRLAEERAAMEAEQERIRIEQEARAAELAKQEREIREAREKIEREEAAKAEAARIEAERIEAEKRAAEVAKAKAEAEAAELARIEAQRPDMERASRWFAAQLSGLLDSESPAIADPDVLARFGKDREILESAFRAVAARWVA